MRAAGNDDKRLLGIEGKGFFEGGLGGRADGFKLGADGDTGPDVVGVFLFNFFRDGHAEGNFGGFFHQDAVGEASDGVGLVDDVRDFEAPCDEADGETDEAAFEEDDVGAVCSREEATEGGDETGEEAKKAQNIAED